MSKRRRFSKAAARPIDKQLIFSTQTVGAAQTSTQLLNIAFPATLVGLRWSISYLQILTTGASTFAWAIVIVRDGKTANAITLTDAGTFYAPEQNCLTFGVTRLSDADLGNGPSTTQFEGNTKSMRKMAAGDELHILYNAGTAAQGTANAVVQFFTKT